MPDRNRAALLRIVRRGVAFELRLYVSLLRWLMRRPDVPDGTQAFGYVQSVRPLLWVWIFASAVEIPVFHVILPWATVRTVVLVLSCWGLLWMLGYLAALTVHPHLVDDEGIRVRSGASIDIAVPWDAIATVSVQRRDLPSSARTLQPRETSTGTDLQVALSGSVNVHIALREPRAVPTPSRPWEVVALSLYADDPRALVAAARARQDEHASRRTP